MLIPYLSMILILIIIGYYTKKINNYCLILFTNLQLASEPLIQDKLNNYQCKKAFNLADEEYKDTLFLLYPLMLSFVNLLVMGGLIVADIPLTEIHITISVLITAGALTEAILLDTFPPWLFNWSLTLITTRDEINLSIIQNRLIDIKTELTDIISGKDISPTKLNELKYEGLELAQTAEDLLKQIQERSQYQA